MMIKREVAEFIGTFTLVLLGCGAATIAGESVGVLGIAFAFGLALIAMAYGIGAVSGCHINPAVSFGAWVAGRMTFVDFVRYAVAQCLGALAGAFVLSMILSGQLDGYDLAKEGLGQNGWGEGYMGGYGQNAALLFEVVATALFVLVILGATHGNAPGALAGIAIGLALVVIHIVGINITGTSVNPARSFGPAAIVGGQAMEQLWLFVVGPVAGAALAGLLCRFVLHCKEGGCCGGHCH